MPLTGVIDTGEGANAIGVYTLTSIAVSIVAEITYYHLNAVYAELSLANHLQDTGSVSHARHRLQRLQVA